MYVIYKIIKEDKLLYRRSRDTDEIGPDSLKTNGLR